MAVILPFEAPGKPGKEWSKSEQAEFVRATALLRRAGLPVIVEGGVSDEGDPWTIFLREDTGDVIVHFARVDGLILAASAASDEVVSGRSFRSVMDRIIRHQPLVLPTATPGDTVYMHPAAIMTAFIATALMWSYNDKASSHYEWRVAEDGSIDHPAPSKGISFGVLRDALLSKIEAAALFDQSGSGALSGRAVLAASIVAVAMAAELIRADLRDPTDSAAFQASSADQPAGEPHGPGTDHAAAAGIPPDGDATAADVAYAIDDVRFDDGTAMLVAASRGAAGRENDAPERWDQAHVREGIDPLTGQVEHDSAGSLLPIDPYTFLRVSAHVDPAASTNEEHSKAKENVSVVKTDGGDSSEPGATTSEPSKVSQAMSSGATPPEVHHVKIADNPSEFLSLVFDTRGVTGAGVLDGKHVQLDGILVASSGQGQPVVDQSPYADMTPTVQGRDVEVSSAPTTNGSASTEYQLVDDILAFTFDHEHELSPSANDLQGLSAALKANSFLPEVDRILVIDLPDLRVDAFRFTDGVVMMSQDLAHQLLPNVDMHAQTEFALVNGVTLKLIGVIDLQPDLHSAA